MNILEKLNKRYPNDEITRLANNGEFAAAAERAANCAMWGLWKELRLSAGMSADEETREKWIADYKARRASKFNKR